jgi:glutamyl-tRNA(Gln) amidotransferase subunit E
VKRGLGTIRQDVNISIRQGARIEIKGWQELKTIPLLIDNEIIRQSNLIKIKQQLKTRGLNKFKKERKEVTKYFEKANSKVVQENLKNGGKAIALKLPKFAGVLKSEICPSKTLGRELSEYAKAYGTKGMIHTDEDLKKYGLENEFEEIKKLMDCRGQDLVIVAVEKEEIASKALDAVYERANLLLEGIPEETRIPNHETATSSYARPLPGANRLYPETDIPNIPVSKGYLKGIVLPEPLDEKTKRYAKTYSIPEELAREVIDKTQDFESLVKRYHVQPSVIAEILINHPKEIKKRYGLDIFVTDHLDNILTKLDLGEITKDGVFEILVEMAQGKKVDYAKYRPMSDDDIIRVVKEIKKNNKDMPLNALIGQVMEKIRGKAEGKRIVEIIKKT